MSGKTLAGPDCVPTPAQERAWFAAARAGDAAARERLIRGNLPLLRLALRGLAFPRVDDEDLRGWARVGLVEAVDRFDPARGLRFNTYATKYVRGYALRCVTRFGHAVRVPAWVREAARRGHRERHAGFVEAAARADRVGPLACDLAAPPPADDDDRLVRLLAALAPADADLVRARFGLDGTPEPPAGLARRLGVSPAAVAEACRRSLRELRVAAGVEAPAPGRPCGSCRALKHPDEFNRDRREADGRFRMCRECQKGATLRHRAKKRRTA